MDMSHFVEARADFFRSEAASGVLLMASAAIALAWANLAPDSYASVWQSRVTVGVAPVALTKALLLWINDGLMAIFFLLVGLEIKRETLAGELGSARKAALPVVAAMGGILAPAAIYAALNSGGPGVRGWGIPMATDIAFALGALALLGRGVAPSLRVFLTAVAIADDLGAVIVIAVFYTDDLRVAALAASALVLAGLAVVNRLGVEHQLPYVALGVALWVAVLESGVHPTIAGVAMAFTIPASGRRAAGAAAPLLERLEHALQPWVAFAIMPLFALANAGVRVPGDLTLVTEPIALGIVLGLFAGKQVGVAASCWLLVRLGLASLPSGATWRQLYGVALLCGIGFTMSLFIATLAFHDAGALDAAKLGIIAGSILSGVAGAVVLARGPRQRNATT
jgi:NhaA family Na+:H+ antiporter